MAYNKLNDFIRSAICEIVLLKKFTGIYLHPTSITQIVKIFSGSVFGATFPKPTDVSVVNVKYKAVMYLDCRSRLMTSLLFLF